MDFTGQKPGGTNSNGTNLVPDSGFAASQNPSQEANRYSHQLANSQPSSPLQNQTFLAKSSPSMTSNTHNDHDNVAINTSINSTADDSDLIEKEWVLKAKSIVENTQNNPYLQSQKLSELRTEYLQKRYGKSLQEDA